jgi:asparagine synthase (glutamine-hydrolysing)
VFFFYHALNDAPLDPSLTPEVIIKKLMPYNPPDKSGFLAREQQSLLVQCLCWNTPQSKFEKTPFYHAGSRTSAAAWARIDNREELAEKLSIPTHDLARLSDTELILLSYLKWDEDCVDHLVGDFVFVIHDRENQRIFCGRDHMGVRPLYYFTSADRFVCATSLSALLGLKDVPIHVRPVWIAEYLMHLSMSFEDTPYERVKKLPPAHCLTVANGESRRRKYFELSATPELKLKGSRKYVEAYREVLEKAISCRLVSDYNMGCELSGGVDSSTVTAFAAKLLGESLSRLHTFAFAYLQLEPQYINAVVQACRLPHNHIFTGREEHHEDTMRRSLDILGYPVEHGNATFHEPFYRLAEELNVRTLQSGFGGDEFGTTIHGYLVPMEMIIQRRFGELFNILSGNPIFRLLRLLKMEWRRRQSDDFKVPAYNPRFYEAWKQRWPHRIVRDELVRRYDLEERYFDTARFDAGYTDLKRFTLEQRWQPFVPTRMENCTLMAAARKIEYGWPLLDIRLVRLFLSIPSKENFYRGMGRYLHRRAIDGVVPEMVAWKPDKYMGQIGGDHLRSAAVELSAVYDLHPGMRECVDVEKLEQQLKALPSLQTDPMEDGRIFQFARNIRTVTQLSDWMNHLDQFGS